MSEFMMTGLRLTQEGVSEEKFQARFGRSLYDVYGKEIDELLNLGLIEYPSPSRAVQSPQWVRSNSAVEAGRGDMGGGIRLTRRGRLLGNKVFVQFI
jgi:oxygen-independent coproporphyrinogen-3 oxidase